MISKILIERLKKVMYKLVDTLQMTFLKDRQITDAALIANEWIYSRVNDTTLRVCLVGCIKTNSPCIIYGII